MRLHADYVDPNQVPDEWDEDENKKITGDKEENMTWEEKFGII